MKTVIPLKTALPALLVGAALGYSVAQVRQPGDEATSAPTSSRPDAAASMSAAATSSTDSSTTSPKAHQFKSILSRHTDREALLWLRSRWGTFSSDDYKATASDILAVNSGRYEKLLEEVMECWGRVAPMAALAFIEARAEKQSHAWMRSVINGWALGDPDGLLAYQKGGRLADEYKYAVVSALAATRPDAIFDTLGEPKQESDGRVRTLYTTFLYALAMEDPARAQQFFARLPETEQIDSIRFFVDGWSDPEAALAWVSELPKGPLRENGFLSIVQALAMTSPREAAQLAIRELTSSNNASSAAYSLVRQWANADPAEAMRFIEESPDSQFKKKALEVIEREFATRAPLEYLDRLVERQDFSRTGQLWNASQALFQKDPEAFEEWFVKNWRDIPAEQISQLLWAPNTQNPSMGVKLLALLPEGNHTDSAYQTAGSRWGQKDMEAARRFMETLPAGTAREHFQIGIITALAASDLPAALKEVEQITKPDQQSLLLINVANSSQHIADVATWLQSRPENKETIRLYERLTQQWANRDPKSAAAWVEKLPESAAKQESIKAYALQIATNEPQAAVEWAGRIRDEKERERTLNLIASRWQRVDKAAADAWIEKSPLPAKVKERYLKQ